MAQSAVPQGGLVVDGARYCCRVCDLDRGGGGSRRCSLDVDGDMVKPFVEFWCDCHQATGFRDPAYTAVELDVEAKVVESGHGQQVFAYVCKVHVIDLDCVGNGCVVLAWHICLETDVGTEFDLLKRGAYASHIEWPVQFPLLFDYYSLLVFRVHAE